jgi:hypothetical protein
MSDGVRDVEAALERIVPGQWRLELEVPLEYFDLEGSLNVRVRTNDPRSRPQEVVNQYAAQMTLGASFPPIVASGHMRPAGLFIIDGVMIYRAAVQVGHLHHPTYYIETELEGAAAHLFFNTHPFPTEPRWD